MLKTVWVIAVILSVYVVEWAILYRILGVEDFVISGLVAVCSTVVTVYVFHRFAPRR
jgi:hypothetical protein